MNEMADEQEENNEMEQTVAVPHKKKILILKKNKMDPLLIGKPFLPF